MFFVFWVLSLRVNAQTAEMFQYNQSMDLFFPLVSLVVSDSII